MPATSSTAIRSSWVTRRRRCWWAPAPRRPARRGGRSPSAGRVPRHAGRADGRSPARWIWGRTSCGHRHDRRHDRHVVRGRARATARHPLHRAAARPRRGAGGRDRGRVGRAVPRAMQQDLDPPAGGEAHARVRGVQAASDGHVRQGAALSTPVTPHARGARQPGSSPVVQRRKTAGHAQSRRPATRWRPGARTTPARPRARAVRPCARATVPADRSGAAPPVARARRRGARHAARRWCSRQRHSARCCSRSRCCCVVGHLRCVTVFRIDVVPRTAGVWSRRQGHASPARKGGAFWPHKGTSQGAYEAHFRLATQSEADRAQLGVKSVGAARMRGDHTEKALGEGGVGTRRLVTEEPAPVQAQAAREPMPWVVGYRPYLPRMHSTGRVATARARGAGCACLDNGDNLRCVRTEVQAMRYAGSGKTDSPIALASLQRNHVGRHSTTHRTSPT